MVLMSDTGGGHRASAEALQAGFEQLYGDEYQVRPSNGDNLDSLLEKLNIVLSVAVHRSHPWNLD